MSVPKEGILILGVVIGAASLIGYVVASIMPYSPL